MSTTAPVTRAPPGRRTRSTPSRSSPGRSRIESPGRAPRADGTARAAEPSTTYAAARRPARRYRPSAPDAVHTGTRVSSSTRSSTGGLPHTAAPAMAAPPGSRTVPAMAPFPARARFARPARSRAAEPAGRAPPVGSPGAHSRQPSAAAPRRRIAPAIPDRRVVIETGPRGGSVRSRGRPVGRRLDGVGGEPGVRGGQVHGHPGSGLPGGERHGSLAGALGRDEGQLDGAGRQVAERERPLRAVEALGARELAGGAAERGGESLERRAAGGLHGSAHRRGRLEAQRDARPHRDVH